MYISHREQVKFKGKRLGICGVLHLLRIIRLERVTGARLSENERNAHQHRKARGVPTNVLPRHEFLFLKRRMCHLLDEPTLRAVKFLPGRCIPEIVEPFN